MPAAHRYLVQFSPKKTPHVFTDILVVGAGIAGLRAALEIPKEVDVLVVTKDQIQQSNSAYAQGGIAGVMSPEDRFENHIEDTLTAGGGLCNRAPEGRRRNAMKQAKGRDPFGSRPFEVLAATTAW